MPKKAAEDTALNGAQPRTGPDDADRAYVDTGEAARAAPYIVRTTLVGTAPLMFHRWDTGVVERKGKAAKNSAEKKRDDVESYVYRDEQDRICLPGIYLVNALVDQARYVQDPRSPRKSARDMFKAALVPHIEYCPVVSIQGEVRDDKGRTTWDVLDARRVVVQRSAITRLRPMFLAGWSVTSEIEVLLPEYISPVLLHKVLVDVGRIGGMSELRPRYGRFQVRSYEEIAFE